MRTFRPTTVAGALALAFCAGTASAQFTNTYIFGDSLSDAGQYGARFTTNPGLVTPMYVGQAFGLSATPSFQGGNDFAQGGAMVNSQSPLVPPGVPNVSIMQQVNAFLPNVLMNRDALYQIQGGANDIFVLAATNPAGAQAGTVQAATDLATAVGKLKAAGAQYVIVQNLPDLGKTPSAAAQGPAAQAGLSGLAGLFNSTLNAAIGAADLHVIQFNTNALFNEILANPALYGFTNTKGVACTVPSSLNCTPATLVAANANMNYVFADGVHPTTGATLLQAQAIASMITGPQQMAALAEAPLDIERAQWRTLDGRMMSAINAPGSSGKFQTWAAYDYASPDISGAGLAGSANLNTISVGGDMRVSDRMLAGLQFAYSEQKGDYGNNNGNFKVREPNLTAYLGYGEGPWYVGATLGLGSLDVDTTRYIQLGPTTRSEIGSTRGYHNVVRLLGGYWFNYKDISHGPFAKLTYENIVVRQFSENGSDSTALTYDQQKQNPVWSSLGYQATGVFSGFRPFARVTWEYNFDADTRQVNAKSNTLNGWYQVPGFRQDSNWWLFDVGVSKDFGKVTGFVSANASAGKDDGDFWALTVGIRVPL